MFDASAQFFTTPLQVGDRFIHDVDTMREFIESLGIDYYQFADMVAQDVREELNEVYDAIEEAGLVWGSHKGRPVLEPAAGEIQYHADGSKTYTVHVGGDRKCA